MKCTACRDRDIELLTPWERFKDNLFHWLFPREISDLSQNKYTQGFGDGVKNGMEAERKSIRYMVKKMYNIDI